MRKFRVNPWLQLNIIGFRSIVTLWLLRTIYKGRHIKLHEN